MHLVKRNIILLFFILILPLSAEGKLSTTPVIHNSEYAKRFWMSRHKAKIELKNKMGKVDLVFLGDSITHNWDREKNGKDAWKKEEGALISHSAL